MIYDLWDAPASHTHQPTNVSNQTNQNFPTLQSTVHGSPGLQHYLRWAILPLEFNFVWYIHDFSSAVWDRLSRVYLGFLSRIRLPYFPSTQLWMLMAFDAYCCYVPCQIQSRLTSNKLYSVYQGISLCHQRLLQEQFFPYSCYLFCYSNGDSRTGSIAGICKQM